MLLIQSDLTCFSDNENTTKGKAGLGCTVQALTSRSSNIRQTDPLLKKKKKSQVRINTQYNLEQSFGSALLCWSRMNRWGTNSWVHLDRLIFETWRGSKKGNQRMNS